MPSALTERLSFVGEKRFQIAPAGEDGKQIGQESTQFIRGRAHRLPANRRPVVRIENGRFPFDRAKLPSHLAIRILSRSECLNQFEVIHPADGQRIHVRDGVTKQEVDFPFSAICTEYRPDDANCNSEKEADCSNDETDHDNEQRHANGR